MQEIRCIKCNKLLFKIKNGEPVVATKMEGKETLINGGEELEFECKCPRCGQILTMYFTRKNTNKKESVE
jgi:phage FluMu protein Com